MSGDQIEMVSEEDMLSAEGDCFTVAADVLGEHAHDDEPWFIVHALVQHPDTGKYHWHAWNEYDKTYQVPYEDPQTGELKVMPVSITNVVDKANGNDFELVKALYYNVGNIIGEKRYSPDEAADAMLKHQHMGPWHEVEL